MSELTHVMLDLETLGTVPGCVAFSIGAVRFFPERGTLGPEFYAVVDVDSALDHYLREDEDTKAWWEKQSAEARATLTEARSGGALKLADALGSFNAWLESQSKMSYIRVWGNGADFDNPILRCMYDAAGIKPYAYPYGGRCYRTVKMLDELLGPKFKFGKLDNRQGTHHNALDDAKSQALHLMENIAAIRQGLFPLRDD